MVYKIFNNSAGHDYRHYCFYYYITIIIIVNYEWGRFTSSIQLQHHSVFKEMEMCK